IHPARYIVLLAGFAFGVVDGTGLGRRRLGRLQLRGDRGHRRFRLGGCMADTRRGHHARRAGLRAGGAGTAGLALRAAGTALATLADGVEPMVGNGRFLDVGGADRTQVVGGFQATLPGQFVQFVELAPGRLGHVQVQALRLVQPFLAPRSGFHQPARVDFEGAFVLHLEVVRDAVDGLHAAVVVLEVVDHDLVPQVQRLEVFDQVRVDHGELARQVRFDVQVLVGRLDRLRYAGDVGDGRGRRNRHAVGVAHADALHALAQAGPVQRGRLVLLQVFVTIWGAAAGLAQQVDGADRQHDLIPQYALERGIGVAPFGQVGR